jgi:hypothetical protein
MTLVPYALIGGRFTLRHDSFSCVGHRLGVGRSAPLEAH